MRYLGYDWPSSRTFLNAFLIVWITTSFHRVLNSTKLTTKPASCKYWLRGPRVTFSSLLSTITISFTNVRPEMLAGLFPECCRYVTLYGVLRFGSTPRLLIGLGLQEDTLHWTLLIRPSIAPIDLFGAGTGCRSTCWPIAEVEDDPWEEENKFGKTWCISISTWFRILQISIICDICMKDHKHTAIYNGMLL